MTGDELATSSPSSSSTAGFGRSSSARIQVDGDPIPYRAFAGVSTTDVIYERLAMTLTLCAPREDLWDFCMKLVAKVPTVRGLPAKAKQVGKIDQFNELGSRTPGRRSPPTSQPARSCTRPLAAAGIAPAAVPAATPADVLLAWLRSARSISHAARPMSHSG